MVSLRNIFKYVFVIVLAVTSSACDSLHHKQDPDYALHVCLRNAAFIYPNPNISYRTAKLRLLAEKTCQENWETCKEPRNPRCKAFKDKYISGRF